MLYTCSVVQLIYNIWINTFYKTAGLHYVTVMNIPFLRSLITIVTKSSRFVKPILGDPGGRIVGATRSYRAAKPEMPGILRVAPTNIRPRISEAWQCNKLLCTSTVSHTCQSDVTLQRLDKISINEIILILKVLRSRIEVFLARRTANFQTFSLVLRVRQYRYHSKNR